MTSEETVKKMIALFDDYSDYFGLSNAKFPDMAPQDKQCEFEDQFKVLMCGYLGHDMVTDHHGRPGLDYCERCQKSWTEIKKVPV